MGMAERGVTRPMAGSASQGGGQDHGPPYSEMRREMLRTHHRRTLWIPWTLIALGAWLTLAPSHFGYGNERLWVEPAGGRGVWFSDQLHTALRARLMIWSDVASGVLLLVLGWRALKPDRPVSLWLACGVGAWLGAAPVLFWAPTAAAYVNGTLVGLLVMALTVLVPGMPNMILYMRMGGAQPPGWSYNPSSWAQRWILIVLGFLGLVASRYLAMYQLGYIDAIWDPFFPGGTTSVLTSSMSHSLPVSDAALGALAYTIEFLMGYMGAPSRWRTMPWMVTLFGILVIPLGLVHIFLVISQPLMVGAWCTFCLAAAAVMLPMIPLEADEVVAMVQHVRTNRRKSGFWKVFWKGGSPAEVTEDERSPELASMADQPLDVVRASLWGLSVPVGLAAAAALGLLAMFGPALLGVSATAADVWHLCGALILVTSVCAMGEVLRLLRYLNLPLGAALAGLPWLVAGGSTGSSLAAVAVGAAVALASLPCGPVRERFGGYQRWVR